MFEKVGDPKVVVKGDLIKITFENLILKKDLDKFREGTPVSKLVIFPYRSRFTIKLQNGNKFGFSFTECELDSEWQL